MWITFLISAVSQTAPTGRNDACLCGRDSLYTFSRMNGRDDISFDKVTNLLNEHQGPAGVSMQALAIVSKRLGMSLTPVELNSKERGGALAD
jgi:hypothetical protein